MRERFLEALEKFGVDYNQETGWLSKPITFVVYDRGSNWLVERVFLFENHFLVFEGTTNSKKISFDKVKQFKSVQQEA